MYKMAVSLNPKQVDQIFVPNCGAICDQIAQRYLAKSVRPVLTGQTSVHLNSGQHMHQI